MKVIGLGNDWRGDDGAGPEAARRLGGQVLSGEPVGLVEALDGADEVVLVDALSSGRSRRNRARVRGGREPLPVRLFGAPSTHALGLAEAVELARSLGRLPRRVLVYGIEGAGFGYGKGLSPEVERAVARVVEEVAVVHEKHLTEDLVHKLEALAEAEGGARVTQDPRPARRALPFHARPFPGALRGGGRRHARRRGRGGGGADRRSAAPGAQDVLLETVELELD